MRIIAQRAAWSLCWALVFVTIGGSATAGFPTSVRDQTAKQLLALMDRAPDEDMIITDVRVRTAGRQILFTATFAQNTEKVAWMFLVNTDRRRIQVAEREYAGKGYTKSILRSATAGGKQYFTAIWTRENAKPRVLVLPDGPIPISGVSHKGAEPLDDMISTFLKEHNVAGATVAVAKDGKLLYSRGFGYADVTEEKQMQPDAVMRIASISKPITAVAILMLTEQGKLSLDEPVAPILQRADFQKPTADERWNNITVRHLLNHSGGWDRDVSGDPMFQVIEATRALKLRKPARQKDLIRWKLQQSLDFDPGEKYVYSNFGYCILGHLVTCVTGQEYSEWVADNILKPRGMQDTRLGKTALPDRGKSEVRYHMQNMTTHAPFWESLRDDAQASSLVEAPYGRWDLEVMDSHGGWVSTAPDLLRFVAGLDAPEKPLLNTGLREVMLARPQLGGKTASDRVWYGCGWSIRSAGRGEGGLDQHNLWHAGALAGTSTLLVRRWDGFSWAVLFNTDRSHNGERLSALVDSKMHGAVDSVSEWPL